MHVSKSLWISIESRVDEANSALASSDTLVIDDVDDGGDEGRGHGCTTVAKESAVEVDVCPCSICRDVWMLLVL